MEQNIILGSVAFAAASWGTAVQEVNIINLAQHAGQKTKAKRLIAISSLVVMAGTAFFPWCSHWMVSWYHGC